MNTDLIIRSIGYGIEILKYIMVFILIFTIIYALFLILSVKNIKEKDEIKKVMKKMRRITMINDNKIMIKLAHNDDHKHKWQSHTISAYDNGFHNAKSGIYSYDLSDIDGYGATKEEALEDFKNKFQFVFNELESFKKLLFESDELLDDIIEVDYKGDPIEEEKS